MILKMSLLTKGVTVIFAHPWVLPYLVTTAGYMYSTSAVAPRAIMTSSRSYPCTYYYIFLVGDAAATEKVHFRANKIRLRPSSRRPLATVASSARPAQLPKAKPDQLRPLTLLTVTFYRGYLQITKVKARGTALEAVKIGLPGRPLNRPFWKEDSHFYGTA